MVVKLGMNAALKASTALSATHRFLGTAPLHLAPAALLALALLSAPIFAQDITWTGALSSVWDRTTTGNWTPNSVPYTGGERAVFTASPTTTTVQVTENVSPGGIVFDATAPSYVITLGDHTNITGDVENASGREQTITVLSTKQLAFSGSAATGQGVVYNVNGTLVYDGNAAGGNSAINVGGVVAFRGSAPTITMGSLSGAGGTGVQNYSGIPITLKIGTLDTSTTYGGSISADSGALYVEKVGSGTLTLTGNNTMTGITVSGGTLRLGSSNAAGTGTITTTGSVISYADGVTTANPITINSNTTQLEVLGTDRATQEGAISEQAGPRPLEKIGSGTLILTGNNTYTGVTTISAGTLQIGNGGASGTLGSGSVVNNASLVFNRDAITFANAISGTGSVTIDGSSTLSGVNSYTGGTNINDFLFVAADSALGSSSGRLAFNNGYLTSTASFASSREITINSGGGAFEPTLGTTLTLNGTISGTGELRANGPGTLVLASGNTYAGGTVLNGGTTVIAANSALGSAGGPIYVNGGMLQTTANVTMARVVALQPLGGSFAPNAGTILNLTGEIRGDKLTMNGAGTLLLTGTASYSDGTNISAGTLQIGNGGTTGALGTGAVTNNSTLVFNRSDAITVANVISGTGSLRKGGAGNLSLSGDSSAFAGSTRVTAGTLSVNGKLGGNVDVDSGATLGGSGTIGGDVTVNGTLSAGNSPGTLTITGDLALNGTSTSLFELNSPGVVGVGNDLVTVGGTLTLDGALDARVAAAGYYRLFDYGALPPGSDFATTNVTSSNGAFTVASHAVHTNVPGQVNLSVLGVGQTLQFWDGNTSFSNGVVEGGSGSWQNFATNWTNASGNDNKGWGGSVAVFQGAPGTVDVVGLKSFDTLQFVTDGYRLQGDALAFGVAAGGTFNVGSGVTATIASTLEDGVGSALSKVGSGTLVLSGTNTYSGGTTLLGGVLSIDREANLGAAAGGLSFDGGALRVTGTTMTSTSRAIDWGTNGGGFDIADAGNTFTIGQTIAGAGSLTKYGAGTLVLNGTNTYGNTLIEAGTLIGSVGSISGNISVAAGALGTFNEAGNTTFAGDIGGLNGTSGAMRKLGVGTLTLSGASTLDWTVTGGGLVSAAGRFSGNVSIASTTFLAFSQATDGIYAGTLSGAGAFEKSGTGMTTMTGNSSAFTGVTTVSGGTLVVGDGVSGKLGGTLEVLAGGTLGGSGTVGSTTLAAGATLAPGNSVGTLTVDGNLIFNDTARFAIEVAAGGASSDLVAVTGTATIRGGNVAHIGMTGTYDPSRTYTILTADLGVSGTFKTVTSDFAFLDPTLSYSAKAVMLTLTRNDIEYATAATTRNQIATARALENLSFGNAVFDSVVQLDTATARVAFDQLSGEIHASARTGLILDSDHLRKAVNDRLRAAFSAVGTSPSQALVYGEDGATMLPASSDEGLTVWGTAFGALGSNLGDGNAASLSRSTGGIIAGADARVTDQVRLGLVAGYGRSGINVEDRASSADIDSYHLGVYGGTQWVMPEGDLNLRGGLAYSWHSLETSRTIGFTGYSDSLSANYTAGTIQAFGELGYAFEAEIARLEPFVNLAHAVVHSGGFAEAGGAAALTSAAGSSAATFATIGIRIETDLAVGDIAGRFNAMVGWRRLLGDGAPHITQTMAGTDPFAIAGSPLGRDALVLDAGLDFDLAPDATFGLSYHGQFASGAQDHGLKASLAIKF